MVLPSFVGERSWFGCQISNSNDMYKYIYIERERDRLILYSVRLEIRYLCAKYLGILEFFNKETLNVLEIQCFWDFGSKSSNETNPYFVDKTFS